MDPLSASAYGGGHSSHDAAAGTGTGAGAHDHEHGGDPWGSSSYASGAGGGGSSSSSSDVDDHPLASGGHGQLGATAAGGGSGGSGVGMFGLAGHGQQPGLHPGQPPAQGQAQAQGQAHAPALGQPQHESTVTSAVFSLGSYPDAEQQLASRPPREKTNFCCELDKVFASVSSHAFVPPIRADIDMRDQAKPAITIADATKAHDMSGSTYIAYAIRTDLPQQAVELEAKHRYSEFEALRKLLTKAYPTVVVPPIPEKHSVAAYAAKPGKAKEDPRIILHRKRMLQTFLNRVAAHPVLRSAHIFHRFVKGDAPWSEILSSSGLSHLLKRSDTIVKVSDKSVLKKPDAHFIAAEDYTARFMAQMLYIERIYKRIASHYSEMASTYTDLGGSYNGWSLTETTLSEAIEQTGQAIDSTVTATNTLHAQLEERFGESLHEYAQFGKAIDKLLRWRHKKHAEFEAISETLIQKQALLQKLEQTEHESQRLAAALNSEGIPSASQPYAYAGTGAAASSGALAGSDGTGIGGSGAAGEAFGQGINSPPGATSPPSTQPPQGQAYPSASAKLPYANPPIPASRPVGIFATLNSLMDNDPELTRRNNISKTKEAIVTLEDQRETTRQELLAANAEIQRDLDRFQRQKIADLRDMLVGYSLAQREYHRKALAAWQIARSAIDRIPAA
ncbi:hypothetical protein BC831DRAFT_467158 [Entophlyctis helioformis]|nr:hypothetical protein BC831DRAFT_467476 [Entophlyctis helioformis]KAI8924108.1 hypothetical protein BC831DRAFT_467158 [Entophlyctis helioformis]